MKLYAGEDGVDLLEFEKALTLVRRRQEMGGANLLEGEDDLSTVSGLKRKVQILQVSEQSYW